MTTVQQLEGVLGKVPLALYRNLCEDLSVQNLTSSESFYPGMSLADAAASRIRASLLKKYEIKGNRIAEEAARLKFLSVNENCRTWALRTDLWQTWDEELVGCFRKAVDDFLYPLGMPLVSHADDYLAFGGTGPGASIRANGGDFYTKLFSSKLSATSEHLYERYRRYTRLFPEWANAELIREANYGTLDVVSGNSLSFVPKNTDISRTICTEPSLNMFIQLGIGHVLNQRLKDRFGIDLRVQQFKNRKLAQLGSIDDRFVTIDLESASDSISMRMLEEFLPGWFLDQLVEVRSRVTMDAGVERELHMISTMGNGYTFSLQTMLFACVVEAAFRFRGVKPLFPRGVQHGNFGINGDDIIVPRAISDSVVKLLAILGFTVNFSKSFFEGPFRESCGGDYHRGRDIRGVYIKRLDSKQDFYVAINQLNRWSAKTGISLNRAVRYLAAKLERVYVPRFEDDSAGIKIPHSMLKERWVCRDTGSLLYRPYVAVGLKLRIMETKILSPRGFKPRIYNLSGLLIALLHGSINGGTIGCRQPQGSPVKYRRKQRVAPYWDAHPEVHPLAGWFSWQRWEIAVHANFNEA
jgi:hypothetical protein